MPQHSEHGGWIFIQVLKDQAVEALMKFAVKIQLNNS